METRTFSNDCNVNSPNEQDIEENESRSWGGNMKNPSATSTKSRNRYQNQS